MEANDWISANQRYLVAQLARIRGYLEEQARRMEGKSTSRVPTTQAPEPTIAHSQPAALERLVGIFDLSPFERDLALLCAGMDLEPGFPQLCAAAQGDPARAYPTFSLALAALPGAHWSALSPAAPLRYWQLFDLEGGRTLTHSALRLDERILHYLTGVPHLDERLFGYLHPVPLRDDLVASYHALAETIAGVWSGANQEDGLSVIQLCGRSPGGKRAIAARACDLLGISLYRLPAAALPGSGNELDHLARLWRREAALSSAALLLDCDDLDRHDTARQSAVDQLLESSPGLVFVSSRDRLGSWQLPTLTFEVEKPTSSEQRVLWRDALGPAEASLNGQVDQLVAQFDLDETAIRSAARAVSGAAREPVTGGNAAQAAQLGRALWQACRSQVRLSLDDLAQRLEPAATWDDLVLPPMQTALLHEIAIHVRQRARVYDDWGFRSMGPRGLGISALFAGASGTGKTMAAEVLAGEIGLDLYRIDLSAVVSKYIGETEKNLRRVFDAAEAGGAILLFDEADALFGKRSEVKDSHDRYANIEIGYLLQRMEAYRGLAILTTNLKEVLDDAFLRRIRFIVQFPFPDAGLRAAIWERIFPEATPRRGLQTARLAQLNLAGGSIRNMALSAAFLAAEHEQPVGMDHLLQAARREYAKLERTLTPQEVRGWEAGDD